MADWLRLHRLWVAGSLLLLALSGLGAWLAWPESQPVHVLKFRELVHSVVATATVQTQHRANVGVQIAGKVQTVHVKEGERFQVGQILLNLDNSEAHSILGYPGGVTSIDITVHDVYAAEEVAQRIQSHTQLQADSWIKTNAQFFSAIHSQSMANAAIRFFVGLSVAFGIASVLVVSVVQRSKEIGILRAMGISRVQVMRVFLLQGGLLGLGGAVIGCGLGAMALKLWLQMARSADGTPMFIVSIDAWLLAQALLLATFTGLLAALAPAMRAARLDPVVAIRG